MPTFDDEARSAAPVEAMWKLLYDPSQFPHWWTGVPEHTRVDHRQGAVTISCLVSDMRFEWRLELADDGNATTISVRVEIPDARSDLLATQHQAIHDAVRALAQRAEQAA